jgi:hypothetical protein
MAIPEQQLQLLDVGSQSRLLAQTGPFNNGKQRDARDLGDLDTRSNDAPSICRRNSRLDHRCTQTWSK